MLIYQNEHNKYVAEFPAMSEYSQSQTSKSDNNALELDIDAIYNLKLRKT
jgi:hypothetical protein